MNIDTCYTNKPPKRFICLFMLGLKRFKRVHQNNFSSHMRLPTIHRMQFTNKKCTQKNLVQKYRNHVHLMNTRTIYLRCYIAQNLKFFVYFLLNFISINYNSATQITFHQGTLDTRLPTLSTLSDDLLLSYLSGV